MKKNPELALKEAIQHHNEEIEYEHQEIKELEKSIEQRKQEIKRLEKLLEEFNNGNC